MFQKFKKRLIIGTVVFCVLVIPLYIGIFALPFFFFRKSDLLWLFLYMLGGWGLTYLWALSRIKNYDNIATSLRTFIEKNNKVICEGIFQNTTMKWIYPHAFLTDAEFLLYYIPVSQKEGKLFKMDKPMLRINLYDILSVNSDGKKLFLNTQDGKYTFKCNKPGEWEEQILIVLKRIKTQQNNAE